MNINGPLLTDVATKAMNDRITRYCEKILATIAMPAANRGERSCTTKIPSVFQDEALTQQISAKFRDDYNVECEISEHGTYIYLKW